MALLKRRCAAPVKAGADWLPLCKIVLLVLGVAAARFELIRVYGSGVPFWDEWREAGSLFKPFLQGTLSWRDLIAAHNEHRIALPRLLALGLFWLNGRWDPILECCLNAILASLGAGWLVWLVYRYVARALLDVALLLALALFALPLSWYNVLWGFQSAFYLQVLLSLVTLWGCGLGRAFTGQWWLGLAAALCALFTNASAFLVSISLLLIAAARAWKGRRLEGQNLATILMSVGLFILGDALQVKKPEYVVHQAVSFSAFGLALLRNLSWPNLTHITAAFAYLPLVFLARSYLRRAAKREEDERGPELLLLVGSWALIQFIAIAYARGGDGLPPSLRHLDFHLVAIFINAITLIVWLRTERRWALALPMLLVWVSAMGAIFPLTINNLRFELPAWTRQNREQLRNVTAYLQTGDLDVLLHKPRLDVPFSNPKKLAAILDDPEIRNFLPAEFQPSLHLIPLATNTGFIANQSSGGPPNETNWWSSFTENPSGAEGILRTAPLTARSGYLEIAVAGNLGSHGLSLKVVPENGTRPFYARAATNTNSWRTVALRTPRGAFHFEATDRRPQGWFAFGEPHEIGPLSYFSLCLLKESSNFLWADVELLLALILFGALRSARLNPAPNQ